MANPILLGVDLSTYTLSSTSADASFPLTNLKTYFSADLWKSAVLSTSTNPQYLNIDFGTATTCDTLVLDNYRFANADTVTLQGATDSGFTTGVVGFLGASIDPADIAHGMTYFTFTSTSRRYWRLNIPNAGFATNGLQISIGNLFLGVRFDFGFPYDIPYKNTNRKFETVEKIALDGRIRTAQPYAGRKMWEFDVSLVSDTIRTNWQTFYNTVRGKLRPFYFLDTDGTTINYVHLDLDYDPAQVFRYNLNHLKKIVLKSQLTS